MDPRAFIRRHPVGAYVGLTYLLSVVAFLVVDGPRLLGRPDPSTAVALTTFPLMVVGVGSTGVGLTAILDGKAGLGRLFARMRRWRVGVGWYAAALLTPPTLILAVLLTLRGLLSPAFAPNLFPFGILFGVPAGFFEEIGWTGYLFPRLRASRSALGAAVLLGVLWGLWHLPIVDDLGSASPHGASWLPFVLAFVALVAALRVLIAWVYTNTGSVLLAQLLHASSTGFLAILGPAHVSPAQEALWYAVYAVVLWGTVGAVVARYGKSLARPAAADDRAAPRLLVNSGCPSLPASSGRV
jgi:membrane protease YdiL (CAAX protease family)